MHQFKLTYFITNQITENEWMRKCAECHNSDNILSQEASEKQKEQ